jgi:protein-disulfide isomerase
MMQASGAARTSSGERMMPMRLLLRPFVASMLLALILPRPASPQEAMTPAQRATVEQIIHDYLLQHPEVLIEALQAAEDKEKQRTAAQARAALAQRRGELVDDATAPVGGNPKGDVTIVEFFDYRCPYCKQVEPALEALLREDGGIRIVYKEWPILGKDSVYAARIALAAKKQGKYAAFHPAMMATKGQITEDIILSVAASVGVDVEKAKSEMNGADIDDIIKRNYGLAEALDMHGTPAWVIGDETIAGAIDIATMKEKIAAARKSG